MKVCAACSQELPKDKFSKKQWQLKCRRCKECIAENREVTLLKTPDDMPPRLDGGECEPCVSDEDLFKEPQRDECPICFLPRPLNNAESRYQSCCGKMLCMGCVHAAGAVDNRRLCPFCRAPASIPNGECIERLKKRVESGDAVAVYQLGCHYYRGEYGLRQNRKKANKLCFQAGELGCAVAYHSIGIYYSRGLGVEKDLKKAKYYSELAAMGGNVEARYNLGVLEMNAGNVDRALKHYMMSARAGYDDSLPRVRECYMNGHATKDDFEKALRAHKQSSDEMKSHQRDAAAAFYR